MVQAIDDETLIAFLDGELDSDGIDRVETALAGAPAVARELCALRRADAALRALLDRAAAGDPPPLRRPAVPRARLRQFAAAALVGLAIASGGVAGGWGVHRELVARQQAAQADEAIGGRTLQAALEHNVSQATAAWRNPDTGASGTVTPVRTWRNAQEQYCREYEVTRAATGGVVRTVGVACREDSGEWRVRAVYY